MNRKKRGLALLLCICMLFTLMPMAAFADNDAVTTYSEHSETNGVVMDKTITPLEGDNYKVTLEQYVKGTVTSTAKPLDIVLVLDVSGSMANSYRDGTTYVETVDVPQKGSSIYTFYVKNDDGSYTTVKWCRHCDAWAAGHGGYLTGDHSGDKYTPKTSADDTDSTHVQFYKTETPTKLESLQTSVKGFIDSIAANATTNNVNHKISIVKFAGTKSDSVGDDKYYDYDDNRYYNNTQIVAGLASAKDNAADLKEAVDALTAAGATSADYGLEKAIAVFGAKNSLSADRQRVVIMFTDGEPNHYSDFSSSVANDAIRYANTLKKSVNTETPANGGYGALVYTIGVFDSANAVIPPTEKTNKYMHYVSSNYPNATSLDDSGAVGATTGYYKTASDADGLNNAFNDIAGSVTTPAVNLGSTAVLTDNVAANFKAPANASAVKVYTAAANAGGTTFAERQELTTASVAINDNAVTVTGFDYSANAVTTTAKQDGTYGKKLIVEFTITVDRNKTYGGTQPTNAGANIKLGNDTMASVENPNVPVTIINGYSASVNKSKVYDGSGFNIWSVISSDTAYPLIPVGVKNGHVNIVYTVKDSDDNTVGTYTVNAGQSTGTWALEAGQTDLTPADPGTYQYTINCTVSDATDPGAQAATQEGSATFTITPKDFKVTYKYAAGSPTNAPSLNDYSHTAKMGTEVTVKSAPTLTGYTFNGWDCKTDGVTVTDGKFTMPAKDVVFEGSWTAITHKVKYEYNGTVPAGAPAVPAETTQAYGTTVEVASDPTLDGYTFSGWKIDGVAAGASFVMPDKDVTLIGSFTPKSGIGYTIKYYWIGDTTNTIATDETGTGTFNATVTASGTQLKSIDGYTLIDSGDNYNPSVKLTDANGNNVIKLYYYKNVALAVGDEEAVYNGKTQQHSGTYTVTAQVDNEVLTGLVFDGVTASGSGTAANTYDVEFNGDPSNTVDTTGKYIVADYSNGKLVIKQRPLMITGASLGEKTYNGSAFTTDQYTYNTPTAENPDVGLLEGDVIGNLAYLLTGTDAGEYSGEFSNPDNETFSIDNISILNANGDKVQSNYAITIELGSLKINPITDEVVVTINGHTDTKYYNGNIQEVNGYDIVDISNSLYSASYVSLKELGSDHAEGKDVGTYYMGLNSGSFVNNNQNFTNVKFVVEDGWLKIDNMPSDPGIYTKIIVKITGNSASEVYDGTEKSVEGYTVEISDPRYTEKDFKFTGTAEAKGTFVGEYPMGLEADQFVNINRRFKNVEFIIVEDGVLTITARPITITAGSAEGWVTDCPITCDEWTSTPPAPGDTVVSVKITGVQNGPGSSPNVPSDAVIKNEAGKDVTGNYDITYVNGLLVAKDLLEKEDHFNYVIGYPDGSVQPNGNITRAEVATIFYRLLTDEARAKYTTTDNSFSDIKAGEWYTKAIATLENANIIGGYPDGTFRPNAPITRAEMATIIAKFANLDENGKSFNDIKGHWAQSYVELAAGNGWINGYEDGTFCPDKNITRAETFAMINRVLDRQVKSVDDLLPTSQMNMWTDNLDPAQWYYMDVQEATNYHKCDRVNQSDYEKWTEKVPDIDWAKIQY